MIILNLHLKEGYLKVLDKNGNEIFPISHSICRLKSNIILFFIYFLISLI